MQHFPELPAEATAWLVLLQQIVNNDNNYNKSHGTADCRVSHAVTDLLAADSVAASHNLTIVQCSASIKIENLG